LICFDEIIARRRTLDQRRSGCWRDHWRARVLKWQSWERDPCEFLLKLISGAGMIDPWREYGKLVALFTTPLILR